MQLTFGYKNMDFHTNATCPGYLLTVAGLIASSYSWPL